MTGNRALLTNFVEKFLGTVRIGNNDFAVISGYGDVVIGSMTIKKVYYVEEDQPLPADASPTTLSPGYVVDSDPEKDEKDLKENPADYHADRGNNDDDESSNDDDVDKDEEDKEEEEHLAPADPSDVSTDDLVPSS
nr:integrase, catalytic region, zinc finger, CCHC-type, peptidase aspartic, catalytic [Tanacetum cinerariifolium]